jgi:tRNA (mo5U34)-methyltransferase
MMTTNEQDQEIISRRPWFHNLHLPDGRQTAPDHFLGDFPRFKWKEIAPLIPEDLSGWQVLDVGCNAGFYSFELARRGATVLGIDLDPHYLDQARWASKELGLSDHVRFEEMQVYDLARSTMHFDLVWFMGVFYHLRYPLLALDILAERTRRLLVFQSLMMPGRAELPVKENYRLDDRNELLKEGWPKMAFIEHRFNNDPTNWWAPDHAAVKAMLRSSGFNVRETSVSEVYLAEPDREREVAHASWNRSEFLSATGREWRDHASAKTAK